MTREIVPEESLTGQASCFTLGNRPASPSLRSRAGTAFEGGAALGGTPESRLESWADNLGKAVAVNCGGLRAAGGEEDPACGIAHPAAALVSGGGEAAALGYIAIRDTRERLEIYPKGLRFNGLGHARGKYYDGKRGRIEDFSLKSRARLREYLLTHDRAGCSVWGITLTLPGEHDPDTWSRLVKALRYRSTRAGVSYVYRVELQRRKVPHLHVIAWIPSKSAISAFTPGWINSLPNDRRRLPGVRKHCVEAREMEAGKRGIGWYAYLTGHASKSKGSQLGWKGKQWDVVGRGQMQELEPGEVVHLSGNGRSAFQRALRRLLRARQEEHRQDWDRREWKKGLSEMGSEQRRSVRHARRFFGHSKCRAIRLPGRHGYVRVMDVSGLSRLIEWARQFDDVEMEDEGWGVPLCEPSAHMSTGSNTGV